MFDFDALEEGPVPTVRIWAVSDVHADDPSNATWLSELDHRATSNDTLILAGDISDDLNIVRSTLERLKARFQQVFYCPGNHELWVRSRGRAKGATARQGGEEKGMQTPAAEDSIQKLQQILALCDAVGVKTRPGEVLSGADTAVLVVPLLSWHHPQWDTEPDIQSWSGVLPVHNLINDYHLTSWPNGLKIEDGTVACAVDAFNDTHFDWPSVLTMRQQLQAVVSFSHFVPRLEVNPEKRYLTHPNLAKAVGSTYLQARVAALQPNVHVFGHTHFGYDLEVEGVRYVQAPLAMAVERNVRGTTVALGDFPVTQHEPFLVWHSKAGWSPRGRGAWSEYTMRYGRRPDVTSLLPSYVPDFGGLRPAPGAGPPPRVGWLPGRMPAWLFGPRPHRVHEAALEAHRIQEQLQQGTSTSSARRGGNSMRGEPKPIEPREAAAMQREGRCAILDVRTVAGSPGVLRPKGSIPLAHPACTATFPCLPDDELLDLGERIMAGDGPRVVVGCSNDADHCRHAAVLLAAMLRLWPEDVRPLQGGFEAWQDLGLPVEVT